MPDIKIIGKIGQFTITKQDNIQIGTLFLYPEAKGFDIHELKSPTNNSLPTQEQIEPYFNTVAVIANTSDTNYQNHWDYCSKIYTNIEKWASFYFGNKNDFKTSPVKDIIKNIFGSDYDETSNKFTEPTKNIENIIGIVLDDEWKNGNDQFRQEVLNFFESFKKSTISSLRNIKIGWSLAPTFKDKPNGATIPWDYMLGQVYTLESVVPDDFYSNSCSDDKNRNLGPFDNSFWTTLSNNKYFGKQTDNTIAVPTVCGSGNCQVGDNCFDERASTTQIIYLLSQRPKNYRFKNFAIWYGTGSQPSCGGCGNITKEEECKSPCKWYQYKTTPCNLDETQPWGCEKKW